MQAIPCYRAAHLLPYLDYLRARGAPVEQGLRQSRLPTLLDAEADIYLPQLPTIDFLKNMSSREDIDELPLRAHRGLKFTDLSDSFLAAARHSPTLKTALETFRRFVSFEDPHVDFWISYREPESRLCMFYRLPLDQQALYFEDWNEILVLIAIVRAFAGAAWHPDEIGFRSNMRPGRFASEQFPNTHFLTGQQATWISLPRHLLSLPLHTRHAARGSQADHGTAVPITAAPEPDLVDSLKAVLTAYLPERPSIQLAATLAATSTRTLQRRLRDSGLSYSDLIGQLHFNAASRLLRETDATVLEIALENGYDDPSHFARAFRRIAGISPHEYRLQHRPH